MRDYQGIIIMRFKVQSNMIWNHTMSTNVNLRSIMDAEKLTSPNFLDWLRNLIIVLKMERLAYVLVETLSQSLAINAYEMVQRAYQKCLVDSARAGLIFLTSMSPNF